jgi:hypothetical protein
MDFLARIAREHPSMATPAQPVVEAYVALRYSRAESKEALRAFVAMVRRFRAA